MGEDTSAIRQEIEQTRNQMGDTVEALGYKTDVPSRAKDKAGSITHKITGAAPSGEGVKQGARRAVSAGQENPLGLAVAAAGAGFIAGMLIPSTSVEKRTIGPAVDDVTGQAVKTGQEALERGKDVAQQVAESAVETAKEAGKEQAGELGESVKNDTSSSSSTEQDSAAAKEPAASTQSGGSAQL